MADETTEFTRVDPRSKSDPLAEEKSTSKEAPSLNVPTTDCQLTAIGPGELRTTDVGQLVRCPYLMVNGTSDVHGPDIRPSMVAQDSRSSMATILPVMVTVLSVSELYI